MTWSTSNSFRVNCRVEQNTNAYEIHPPKTALGRLAEAVFGAKKPMEYSDFNFSGTSVSQPSFLDGNCRSRGSYPQAVTGCGASNRRNEPRTARQVSFQG